MRKNAKKLFALILALCMSLTLLTACGGDTAGSDSGVGESSSGGETITWRLQSSYPFVDLPLGNTLRCKLFPSSKFTIHLFPKVIGHSIIKPAINAYFSRRVYNEMYKMPQHTTRGNWRISYDYQRENYKSHKCTCVTLQEL